MNPVLVERRGATLLITLNRPESRNAIDADVSAGIGAALTTLDEDPGLRVGVLTGTGTAFCAGADLKEVLAGRALDDPEHPEWGLGGLTRRTVASPLIAAVNGPALGGGTELALACDLVVMADDAVLGLPEPRRGLIAGAGGLLRLGRQLPPKVAAEIVLTAASLPASEAYRLGLVNRVVPREEVVDTALALAAEIAENAPLAVTTSKRLLGLSTDGDEDQDALWRCNDAAVATILASADAAEGTTAFVQRRRPRWSEGAREEENP
ncbi:crotonase/enoyl-CoA hydratase family protein [Pseudonocardia nematodicida]|uniref:Crotonase/enoyl-CoA hydratase family protein n=1 Tax=Pseudonocardia nematodicida TaxID=1206997 RepID=A0ABV1KEA9_9PSEU